MDAAAASPPVAPARPGGARPAAEAADDPADLAVRCLRKSFAGRPVLDGIAFAVARREAVALIGANGAGKSTALRCALRLIEPDAGEVDLFGIRLGAVDGRALRRLRADVGFVFQRHNLVPRLSALSNVVHGGLGRSGGVRGWCQALAPRAVRERALACLDRVGLADHAMRRADRLSGGQSQRVAIARALMQAPRMVVADEPVASLDPVAGEEVMALFVRLVREEGMTLLFTSHNVQHALACSDRVVVLKDGRVALDAPSATLSAAGLMPYYG